MTGARRCGLLEFVGAGVMMIFGCLTSAAFAQNTGQPLPVVTSASVPLYPRTALLTHIQGTVKIRVTTDGKRASSLEAESGPPMLAQAAEDNIRTWRFKEHKPLTFSVTFRYVIEEPPGCSVGNATAILHMPTDVEVRANPIHTCDPASTVPRGKKP